MESAADSRDHEGSARRVRQGERSNDGAMEGTARRALGRRAGILRKPEASITNGLELSLRHRSPPGSDLDVPAPDGIEGAADLWAERRRAVTQRACQSVNESWRTSYSS